MNLSDALARCTIVRCRHGAEISRGKKASREVVAKKSDVDMFLILHIHASTFGTPFHKRS